MRVLCHGLPFFRDYALLREYGGPHELRSISPHPQSDYQYDPRVDTWPDLVKAISRDWAPELALFWTPENDPPPLNVELSPIRTVALAGDWNLFYGAQRVNLGRYDLVLSDKPGTRILASEWAAPAFLFPLYSYDPHQHAVSGRPRDIDVLYLGNMNLTHYRRRGPLLEALSRMADRYTVVIARGAFGQVYGEMLARAKIVFNCSVRGELNLRFFETIAAGALPLVEADNAEVGDYFRDGEDVVLYTPETLEDRIAECLNNWELYSRVAQRARQRSSEFSCETRMTALIDWAAAQSAGGRAFARLDEIAQLEQTCLLYAVSQRMEYGPLEQELVARLVRLDPDNPVGWTAFGRTFYAPKMEQDETLRGRRCITTLIRAAEQCPRSAVFAMNVAEACRLWQAAELEERWLRACLERHALDGAEWLLGQYSSEFWTRWLMALARKTTSLELLHAEAHFRLARALAQRNADDEALEHLSCAEALDPESSGGIALRAEILARRGRRDEAADILFRNRERFYFAFEYRTALEHLLCECGRLTDAAIVRAETARMRTCFFPKGYHNYDSVSPPLSDTARQPST